MRFLKPDIPQGIRYLFAERTSSLSEWEITTSRKRDASSPNGHGMTGFEYWREVMGESVEHTASFIGTLVERYNDIEEGELAPSLKEVFRFCAFCGVSPVDLFNPDNPVQPHTVIEAMIITYKDPAIAAELSALPENYREIAAELLCLEASSENSYNILHEAKTQYYMRGGKDNFEIAKFTESLLVNDGNPVFVMRDVMDVMFEKESELEKKLEAREEEYRTMQKRLKSSQELLYSHFGKSWNSYSRLLEDLPGEGWSEEDIKDFFKHDLPSEESQGSGDRLPLWSVYMGQQKNMKSGLSDKQAQRKAANQRIDFFYDFAQTYMKPIQAYHNRQSIMASCPELKILSKGDPTHPSYWPIHQVPVALLPPPEEMSDGAGDKVHKPSMK